MIKKIITKDSYNKIYNISNPNNIRNSSKILSFFEKKFKIKINNLVKEKVIIKNSIINPKLFGKDYMFKFENNLEKDFISLVKSYKVLKTK
jgi:hypothetical protein